MNCSICGEPIILVPSAAERAKRDVSGKTAEYYAKLFTTHASCELKQRTIRTNRLMERIRAKNKST